MDKAKFEKCLLALDAQWQHDLSVTSGFGMAFQGAKLDSLLPDNSILVETILRLMADSIGCDISLLEWWCSDNDFGHNKLGLVVDGVRIKVRKENLYECLTYCSEYPVLQGKN